MGDIINNLSSNMNKMANSSQNGNPLPQAILQMEKLYDNFCQQMNKSDFCNSPRRYMVEQGYVKQLLDLSTKYDIQPQIEKWSQKSNEITSKLSEFGIKINP